MARKAKKGLSVNLGDVESYFRPPEGPYECEIIGVEEGENDSLAWSFKVTSGKYADEEFRGYTGIRDGDGRGDRGTAWQTKELVKCTSVKIEKGETQDLSFFEGLIGEVIGVKVGYREWEGKEKLNLSYFIAGDDEDEKPAKKSRRKDDDEEEEAKPRKKSRRDDDDEEEDEKPARGKKRSRDDDEEEEAPKGKKGKKPKVELTQEEIRDMDTDELEKLVDKHELDVDLSEFKTLKKQQNAVIDAASEAGLLSED